MSGGPTAYCALYLMEQLDHNPEYKEVNYGM